MDPITIALGLAQFVPSIVRWIGGDKAGTVAQKAVDIANQVTGGAADPVAALAKDPAALAAFQAQWSQYEISLYQEETKRLQIVNDTMRIETGASDPYVRRWRPTWGYVTAGCWALQAVAVFVAVIGATYAACTGKSVDAAQLLNGIGTLLGSMTVIWGIALSVLGVAVQARSNDKAVAAGNPPAPGMLGAIAERIRGK